jgi:putative peptidoglycan lipid II flippase
MKMPHTDRKIQEPTTTGGETKAGIALAQSRGLQRAFVSNVRVLTGARVIGILLSFALSVMLADKFGAGATSDAFFLVRRLVTSVAAALERAIRLMFVPLIIAELHSSHATFKRRFFPAGSIRIGIVTVCVALVLTTFASPVVGLIAPGFDEQRAALAQQLLRILVWVIPLTLITALSLSWLNAARTFGKPELIKAAPRFFGVVALWTMVPLYGVDALAWAILLGTALAAWITWRLAQRLLRKPWTAGGIVGSMRELESPRPRSSSGKRLAVLLIGQLHMQGALWIDLAFASTLMVGAVSTLEYAQRLFGLLPGVLANSLLTVAYTELSHNAAQSDYSGLRARIADTIRANLFLTLPAGVVLVGVADVAVDLLLRHGAFDATAAAETTLVMRCMLPGLMVNILASALLHSVIVDAQLPSVRIISIATAIGLGSRVLIFLIVVPRFELVGLVLGSAGAMLVVAAVLYIQIRRSWGGVLSRIDMWTLVRIAACGVVASAALFLVRGVIDFLLPRTDAWQLVAALASAASAAMVYLLAARWLGVQELRLVAGRLSDQRES